MLGTGDQTKLSVTSREGDSQRPFIQRVLDEEIYEIAAVLDQWYEPLAMYFKVQSTEGKTYLLRYDEQEDEWTLQSGFDGDELLAI